MSELWHLIQGVLAIAFGVAFTWGLILGGSHLLSWIISWFKPGKYGGY
jgi:hypothetical protein